MLNTEQGSVPQKPRGSQIQPFASHKRLQPDMLALAAMAHWLQEPPSAATGPHRLPPQSVLLLIFAPLDPTCPALSMPPCCFTWLLTSWCMARGSRVVVSHCQSCCAGTTFGPPGQRLVATFLHAHQEPMNPPCCPSLLAFGILQQTACSLLRLNTGHLVCLQAW